MDSLLQDIRFAVRSLIKTPGFAVIATLCLALGIATNTTLFSVFDAIVVRPLPFDHPDRLVSVVERDPRSRGNSWGASYRNFLEWRSQSHTMSDMAAWSGRTLAITEGTEPERLSAQLVTASLFPMLGVRPQLGRLFRSDDDQMGAPGVILLSDGLWRRRYAGDSSIIGRVISVNNEAYTVVGVMPPLFRFPDRSEIWIPMAPRLGPSERTERSIPEVVGRLKPGATLQQADQEMAGIISRVDRATGIDPGNFVGAAVDFQQEFRSTGVVAIVTTMYGAVTFVLLIACANIANLLLTRASARQREIAIRAAIGAGRGRIIRQLVTEAVVLGLAAGLVAVPLAWIGLKLIDGAIPPEDPAPYYMHWSLDVATLLYTAGISVVAALLFGLAPALQESRGNIFAALKDKARGTSGAKNRVRNALVVIEVALSLVLLVGASLFTRSFSALEHKQLGFDTTPIMTARFFLPGKQYDSSRAMAQRVQDVLSRVRQIPGVDAAAISNLIPLDRGGNTDGMIIDGHLVDKGHEPPVLWAGVAGQWISTLGVRITSGRDFSVSEQRDSAAVAIVDQSAAKLLSPAGSAIGTRFRLARDSSHTWLTVVGVIPDVRMRQLDDRDLPLPSVYLPYQYDTERNNGLLVRVHGNPLQVAGAIRAALRSADPSVPVFQLRTMEKVRQLSFWQYGLFGWMFGIFGVIALFLAAIGVYGVISYTVSQRTQEIGVRVALGAQRGHVVRLVVQQGMRLAVVGILLGLVGAFGVTRVVASFLYEVSTTDPVSFIGVAVFLAAVALVASLVPARRATAVDPIVALRAE